MSNKLVKACKDGSGSSGTSLHSPQACWMSRWTQPPPSRQGSLVTFHSQTFSREEGLDHKQKRLRTSLNISSDITKAGKAGLGVALTIRAKDVGKERSECPPFFFGQDSGTPNCTHLTNSPSAMMSNPLSPKLQPSNLKDSVPNHDITVFKRHCSKNDLTSLDQGSGKHEKYSAIVVHERSGFSPVSLEGNDISCPVRNVEAMRICTAVDSIGNSHGHHPPLFSKTTHHFLFTSRTGVAHESSQHRGVKIQPLWSSTDSEKDNLGDAETPRSERSIDLSAETDTMDVVALTTKNDYSGMLFPPIPKGTTAREKALLMDSVNRREDKGKGKLPVIETAGTNSLNSVEPSTSRTQSLEAEHLLSCADHPSESNFPHIDECNLQEPNFMSVKCLKPSSFEMDEFTLHEKTQMFMKHNIASPDTPTSMDKHQSKGSPLPSQNVVPMLNCESSLRTQKNPIFQSSWIQRWCQDRPLAQDRHPSKNVVIREPDSSKLPLDELEKKQFPSIAAVALMGKSVDGFHACKFTKRGPLVVWNSEDY